ncbi:hypothetical protein TNCV_335511 [Trichonephila clavipes]|nr:hypothetical protein TNCV_335511 [Trichonephila clavipes]
MIWIGNVIYSTGAPSPSRAKETMGRLGFHILLQFAACLMTQWNGICYTRSGSSGSTSESAAHNTITSK